MESVITTTGFDHTYLSMHVYMGSHYSRHFYNFYIVIRFCNETVSKRIFTLKKYFWTLLRIQWLIIDLKSIYLIQLSRSLSQQNVHLSCIFHCMMRERIPESVEQLIWSNFNWKNFFCHDNTYCLIFRPNMYIN